MESLPKKKLAVKSNFIYTDSLSEPISGFLVIFKEKVEKVLPAATLDSKKKMTSFLSSHEIIDYSDFYVTPGLVDLNVALNSTFREEWRDTSNSTKQAISGGVTTIVDTVILKEKAANQEDLITENEGEISINDDIKSDRDAKRIKEILNGQLIQERMNSLKNRLYCDCGLFGNLHSKNFSNFDSILEATAASLLGFRVSLAPPQSPGEPFLHRRHIEDMLKSVASVKNKNLLISINPVAANARDLFLPSPCRRRALEKRLVLCENIGDYSNFGGGINAASKNENNQPDPFKDHKYDEAFCEFYELKSAELRQQAKMLAQFNEENNISRMEMMEYQHNPAPGEEKRFVDFNESLEKIDGAKPRPIQQFSFLEDDSETEMSNNYDEVPQETEKPGAYWEKYQKKALSPSKNKFQPKEERKEAAPSDGLGSSFENEIGNGFSQSQKFMTRSINQPNENKHDCLSDDLNRHNRNKLGLSLQANGDSSKEMNSMKSPLLTPSRLMQRRELSMQSPALQSNRSKFNLTTDKKLTKNLDTELKKMRNYQCYLSTFPLALEENGVLGVIRAAKSIELEKAVRKGTQVKLLFTSLSSPHLVYLLREAKKSLNSFQVFSDTCAPFLQFFNEKIKDGEAIFKSCPPIRERADRDLLVKSLIIGAIDCVSSAHLQVPFMHKYVDGGNFRRAFSGLSNIGCNLQVVWTRMMVFRKGKEIAMGSQNHDSEKKKKEEDIHNELKQYVKVLISACCEGPAKILNISHKKGTLKPGMHADFVIWKPLEVKKVRKSDVFLSYHDVFVMKNQKFYGEVKATYLRGSLVFLQKTEGGAFFSKHGQIILNDKSKK